jgi:hypothetical protein
VKIFDNPILMVIAAVLTSAAFYYATEYFFGESSPIIGGVVVGCFLGIHWCRNDLNPDKFGNNQ